MSKRKPTITGVDIRNEMRRELGLTKREANRIYAFLFDPRKGAISKAVVDGIDVKLTGFGTFTRRDQAAGPKESFGRVIELPARNYPVFKSSPVFRSVVRDSK